MDNVLWFTPMGGPTIGIVLTEDKHTKEVKAYIGIGAGFDEETDIQAIKSTGAKLHRVSAETLIRHFQE